MRRVTKWFAKTVGIIVLIVLAGPLWVMASGEAELRVDWPRASMRSVGIAPNPKVFRDAIVQVYAARAFSWRGAFSVHTWIAVKPANANRYTRHEVVGWRMGGGGSPVISQKRRSPDGRWFDSEPRIIFDVRGAEAARIIPAIEQAIKEYPFDQQYEVWPGPNSNTFTAHIARQVDGLDFEMPANAVGKDYLGTYELATSPSKSGVQWNLGGLFGFMWAEQEGMELNLLGLVWGVDWESRALKLPGIGSVHL